MPLPILSIITVNLNNKKGLLNTIKSVNSQSYKDFEWIIIDGGSTDGSKEIIEKYQDRFSFWCSEPDKGVYNAMNKGIIHSKGEWVQFLNSGDCLFDANTLKNVFSMWHNSDILYGNAIVEINGEKVFRSYPKELSLSYIIDHPINHQASFYKRCLYQEKMFDEENTVISDYIYLLELALKGKKFEYVDMIIATTEEGGLSSRSMGVDNSSKVDKIIPPLIRRDMDYLS